MESLRHSPRRLFWIGLGVSGVVIIVIVGIFVLTMTGVKKQAPVAVADDTPPQVATQEQVQRDVATLGAALRQADTDQAAAKAALKDGARRAVLSE